LYEYQKEGFLLFSQMMDGMRQAIIRRIFYSEAALENLKNSFEAERARREAVAEQMNLSQETEEDSSGAMEFHDTAVGDPAAQRLRLEAQRKARRKMRKK
jgi:preprotein translocase subunit SecA